MYFPIKTKNKTTYIVRIRSRGYFYYGEHDFTRKIEDAHHFTNLRKIDYALQLVLTPPKVYEILEVSTTTLIRPIAQIKLASS